jgi:hypothetical protein
MAAESITICTENKAFRPITYPDKARPAPGQQLIYDAAAKLNLPLAEVFASWRDCQKWADQNKVQAIAGAGFAAININVAVFPMRGHFPDTDKALGRVRTSLFRRAGSTVDLRDGRFIDLKTPVGILNAYQVNSLSVAKFGGTPDDNSRDIHSLAQRLLGGRLDLVAAGDDLVELVQRNYVGKIEVLAEPLDHEHYYLAFSKSFYQQQQGVAEAIWQQIADIRQQSKQK